ncbi:MAG TPA: MFS transporter [Candidatus Dormibacteraeota bacterium]|nr:MFS transporter [Candidatus Dormibacteraeota bacterium]
MYLGPFATMADRFAVAPLLIPISVSLHVSLAAASGAASLYYLAYGVFPAGYGMLADRYGRVRIMRVALAGTAVADLLSSFSPNLVFLLIARFVTGALACGVLPTVLVYVGDRFAFRVRQAAVANVQTFVAMGTAVGTLGAGLTAHFLSWRIFFFFPGAAAALLAIFLGRVPESLSNRSTQNPLAQVALVLRNRWSLLVLGLGILVGAVMFGFVTFLAPSLEANGESAAVAGTVVASYGLSVLLCSRLLHLVARVVSVPLILAGGAALLLLGYVAASVAQSLLVILLTSVLAGAAYAFMQSTFQTWATDVVPEARATSTALFASTIFAGAALATATVAGLAAAHQYSTLFLIAALVTLPVLIAGSIGRWRYPGSEILDDPQRGSQIG